MYSSLFFPNDAEAQIGSGPLRGPSYTAILGSAFRSWAVKSPAL